MSNPSERGGTSSLLHRMFPPAPPAIEIELTAKLLSGSEALGLVGLGAGVVGIQAALNRDLVPAGLLLLIALVALARLIGLRRLHQKHGTHPRDLATARQWQRRYALGSFATGLLMGMTALFVLSYRDPTLALLVVFLLCCYVFSLILRTAVRPLVCLPSVATVLVPTLTGLPLFLNQGSRLDPTVALAALATVAVVLVLSCIQLTGHLYRTTLNQLMAQRDLMRFARRDPLTGLNNRLALREHFEMLSPGPTRPAALLYLDLDGFKPVNDLHGHQAGDALLSHVAGRLAACLRQGEGAFRIGGDEFVVLMSRVQQRSEATAMARRLLASLAQPYALDGATVRIGASIGIALADASDSDLDDLVASADAALYDAKGSGRGTFRFAQDVSSLRLIA